MFLKNVSNLMQNLLTKGLLKLDVKMHGKASTKVCLKVVLHLYKYEH